MAQRPSTVYSALAAGLVLLLWAASIPVQIIVWTTGLSLADEITVVTITSFWFGLYSAAGVAAIVGLAVESWRAVSHALSNRKTGGPA